jgi:hypothetical protein
MSMRRAIKYAVMMTLLGPAPALVAQAERKAGDPSPPQLIMQLSDALESFDRGTALLKNTPDEALAEFRAARDRFQAVVDAGIDNGWLYYNLGNTHLRLGEIGEAIADYRRAERLIPNDQRLKANLRFARSLRRNHIESSGKRTFLRTVFFWHYSSAVRTRGTGAMIGYGLFWLLLAGRVLWPQVRLGYPILACLVLWVTLGASVAIDLPSQNGSTEGVLVVDQVVVRKGNGDSYDPQFEEPLHEGVEFKMVEQRGGWLRIELADGNQGWARTSEVELF